MKLLSLIFAGLLASATWTITPALAHGDHGAHFDGAEAVDVASHYLVSIVEHKTPIEGAALDESWLKVADSDKAVVCQAAWYYVISLHNAEADKTLYMLISTKGRLYKANYNGEFPGLE